MADILTERQSRAFSRLKAMMHTYLVERDVEKTLSFYTEDIQSIGTGAQEVALNKSELRKLIEDEIKQDPIPFQIAFKQVVASEHTDISLYAVVQVKKQLSGGIPIQVEMRQSAMLCEVEGTFYIKAVHVSFPAAQQTEEEFFPIIFGEQLLSQQASKIDRKLLQLVGEALPGGIMGGYCEPDFPLYFINDRMLEYLGYPTYDAFVESVDGLVINCIYPSDREHVIQTVFNAFQTGDTYTVTYRMFKADGGFVWVYDKGRKITVEDGREVIISVCFDVTAQVEAENELSFIAQSQIGGLFKARIDEGFTILYANECYYQIHGYTQQEIQDKLQNHAVHLVYPEDLPEVSQKIEKAIQQGQTSLCLEYRIIRGNGQLAWIHASAGLTHTNEGMILSGMVINIDERKHFEQQLQWSESRFQIAIEQTKINVWEYDLKTRCIIQTDKSHQVFGGEKTIRNVPDSLIQSESIHPDDAQKYLDLYEQLYQGAATAQAVVRILATDGKYYWEKINYTNIFDPDGRPVRAVAVSEDITAQKEAEQRFFQEEHLLEMLSADVLISAKINLTQNKVLRIWSENYQPNSFQDLVTYDQLYREILACIANKGDQKRFEETFSIEALEQAISENRQTLHHEYRCTTANGKIIWCSFHLAILCDPESSELYALCYVRDINERKKIELALRERAERDALTGLYNRQTAESMIGQLLSQNQEQKGLCAFFIIDMDDFKQINDKYGHHIGDKLLEEIGRILRVESDGNSIAGRFGGDEFILFFEQIPNRKTATEAAEKVCRKLNISFSVGNEPLCTSASVGVVISEIKGTSFQKLFQQADSALYDAKFQGKAQFTCFNGHSQTHTMGMLYDGCIAKRHLGAECMMDELDDAIFVIDEINHSILFMNESAQREFDLEDYHGRKCYEVLQGFSQPCVFCQNHLPEEQGFKTRENLNSRLHKRFMIRDKIIHWDGARARLEIFTDLTKHEAQLNSKVLAEHVLLECASLLLTTKSLEHAVQGVLENLGKFYRADRTYYVKVKDFEIQVSPEDWCAQGVFPAQNENERIAHSQISDWLADLKEKRVVLFHEIEQIQTLFPEKFAILTEKNVQTFAAVALLDDSNLIGYIGIENPRGNLDNTTLLQSLSYFMTNEIMKRRIQVQQKHLADHDLMTGLLNWECYTRSISQLHPEALSSLGAVVADVNHLRLINQEYGHDYGDSLLQNLAGLMIQEFGKQAAFRIAGDSFVALSQDITYETFMSKVQRLRSLSNNACPGCVSFGFSWEDEDIIPNQVLNIAWDYLTMIKHTKGDPCHDDRLRAIRLERLKAALDNRNFQVYLQPKAEIKSGEIKGAEALVRYSDELHGTVPPMSFIPQLEAENNIHYIDFFVLEEVCKTLRSWLDRGLPVFPISINFSRCTLIKEHVVDTINAIANRYRIDRSLLEIEITESMGELNRRTLTEISQQVIDAGYRLSLDDFGSEYSNISILSALPISGLKFDKSVMNDLYSNATTRLLVENLIHVCHEMGIDSIAEGVEEKEQLDILKSFGCTYAQGYFFNKPLPIKDFERKYLEGSMWIIG